MARERGEGLLSLWSRIAKGKVEGSERARVRKETVGEDGRVRGEGGEICARSVYPSGIMEHR